MQVRIVMTRRMQIMKGNYIAQALSTTFVYHPPRSLLDINFKKPALSYCKRSSSEPLSLRSLMLLPPIFHEVVSYSCRSFVRFPAFTQFAHPSVSSSVFLPALFSMSEIPALFSQRPIVLRQQRAAMYHPMVEALAMTLVDVPFTLITIILFSVIIYFIVKLQQSAAQFL